MSIVSFTGSGVVLTPTERNIVEEAVYDLKQPRSFFSGAAVGVDIWAAACAIKTFPDSRHIVVVPTWISPMRKTPKLCKHDESGVDRLVATAEKYGAWLEVHGRDGRFAGHGEERDGLMRRNDVLAVNCTHLVAFPPTPKEVTRSGTWATVRRARKLKRPILIVPLDGSDPFRDRG